MPIKEPFTKKLYDRLYQKANRVRLAAARRQRYATDPQYRAQQIAAAKAYRDAHKNDPAYLARTRKASLRYSRQKRAAKLAATNSTP